MVVGKHLLVDMDNISYITKLTRLENVIPLMNSISNSCKLNVVGMCSHKFQPIGCTLLYLLEESHFSIHTYPEFHSCSIDLYTCNKDTDFDKALDLIYKYFNTPLNLKRILNR